MIYSECFFLFSVQFSSVLKGHFFSSCHLSVCTDVYPGRLSRPSCWRHRVTFPHHMTTVPAYLCCTACACLYSRTGHSTKLLQMCAVPSLHLPAFTRLVQLWLRNPDWRPRNHAQRVWMTLVSVLFMFSWTQDEASARMCMSLKFLRSVMSLKGRRFSLDSYAWVQTLWLKTEWKKILKVGQRFLHMQLNASVNNPNPTAGEHVALLVSKVLYSHSFEATQEWNLPRDLCCFITCRTGESNMTTFIHTVVKRQLGPLQCF